MRVERASEQSVLGWALTHPEDARELLDWVAPHMFSTPGAATVAGYVRAMAAEGLPIDGSTVLARVLASEEATRALAGQPGPWLHEAQHMAAPVSLEAARWHGQQIRSAYGESRLGARLAGAGEAVDAGRTDVHGAILEASQAIDEAEELSAGGGQVRVRTADELLATNPPVDWLIPGLLARRERVMITGTEGLGKSELLAMLAVCAASGTEPWTGEQHEPLRVLHVDCENDLDQLRRRYRRLVTAVERFGELDRSRLMVEVREAGMDLTRPDDVVWLSRLLSAAAPHILIIGPLYKLHRANINEEGPARGLVAALDDLRVRHDVAVLIEAHPGLSQGNGGSRELRPRGSSLFLGWPNVGFGIRPHQDAGTAWPPQLLELASWRGNREARAWPDSLRRLHGSREWPSLPFSAEWSPGNSPSERREMAR